MSTPVRAILTCLCLSMWLPHIQASPPETSGEAGAPTTDGPATLVSREEIAPSSDSLPPIVVAEGAPTLTRPPLPVGEVTLSGFVMDIVDEATEKTIDLGLETKDDFFVIARDENWEQWAKNSQNRVEVVGTVELNPSIGPVIRIKEMKVLAKVGIAEESSIEPKK